MQALNKKLTTATYVLPGSTTATQADADALAEVDMALAAREFPHVLRWARHISALMAQGYPFPARPAGQAVAHFSGIAYEKVKVDKRAAAAAKKATGQEGGAEGGGSKKTPMSRKQIVVDVGPGAKPEDRRKVQPSPPALGALHENIPQASGAEKRYITTAINYTNGWGHIGHAYEALLGDVIARWYRLEGNDTFYVTGTDEHGQKIATAAVDQGVQPQALVDIYADGFRALNQRLLVSNDFFVRTTQQQHKETCQAMWLRCKEQGDIYLDTYEGYYLVREERFVTENEAKEWDFKDPQTGKELQKMKESSYFFRMSKYIDWLIEHIESHPEFLQPQQYRKQLLSRLRADGLRDLSVSRCTFDWGVPAPEQPASGEKHVMYVWFDALVNYVSAVRGLDASSPTASYWPASAHLIGKDIVWFHCVIWPCMLHSAKVALPKSVIVHGFISAADGRKMSKSFGTVVDPHDLLDFMAADTFRWYMCREAAFGDDLKFSVPSLKLMHNADMVSNLGNFVARAVALSQGSVPAAAATSAGLVPFDFAASVAAARGAMSGFELAKYTEVCVAAASDCNKYVQDEAPWKKEGEAKAHCVRMMLESCLYLAHLFAPFTPQASDAILHKMGREVQSLDSLSRKFDNLKTGEAVVVGSVLFQPFHDVAGDGAK